MFETDSSHYKTVSILGHCCDELAVVHLAKHLPTDTLVAVKKFNMDKAGEEAIQQEIILTRQLQHPNIIVYHAAFVSGPEVCVVSPLMAFGSCRDLMRNHFTEGLPEVAVAFILRDALDGLDYIHKKGFIHRAIRASHILVSSTGRACLSGLRYACQIIQNGKWQRKIHSFPGSTARNLNWLSPELLEQNMQGYNEKSDIYSVGITICELANGIVPFEGTSKTLMLTEKVKGAPPHLLDSTTFPIEQVENDHINNTTILCSPLLVVHYANAEGDNIPSNSHVLSKHHIYSNRTFTESFHQITELCLLRNPCDRPTAGQLLTHSLFKHCRRNYNMTELLHPIIPMSDRIANNPDDVASFETAQKFSEMDLQTCEWDFS